MNQEVEVWQFALAKLEKHESVTLLLVAESSGSSPGRQGFKMIVAGDEMCGSIGGGVMEVALVERAKVKSKKSKVNSRNAIIEQVHREKSPHSSGMICSGKQTVIFRRLDSSDLKMVREVILSLEKREQKILEISPRVFRLMPSGVKASGEIRRKRVTLNALRKPPKGGTQNVGTQNSVAQNGGIYFEKMRGDEFVYREKLGFKNNLFIVGGGHCAFALSELMSKMDFHITLFDDRPNLNTLEKNNFVHEKRIIKSYEKIASHIPSGKNNYVIVMTLGYKSDEVVIRKLFDKKFKYFGVLGSEAKMKTLLRNLEQDGFDKKRLAEIHTPIGIPINSHTPEEIAISIAAEIISVKNA